MFTNMLFCGLRQLVGAECLQPVKRTFSKGEVMVNKEDNVFRAERDLKGLKAKVQDSRFRFVTYASSIKYFLCLYPIDLLNLSDLRGSP